MKNILVLIYILTTAIIFNGCKKSKEVNIVKGYLLQSCDNPEPLAGALLQLSSAQCKNCGMDPINEESTTQADGYFEFKYEQKNLDVELKISGTQSNGLGTINYVFGIPENEDVNIGNVYNSNNFFTLIKLSVQRPTSIIDTVFYDKIGEQFTNFVIGPFTQNQIIDTAVFRNTQFFDKQNKQKYSYNSDAVLTYKIGEVGKHIFAGGLFEECKKYNEFIIEIK